MAAKQDKANKKPNIIKQIVQIYRYTHEEDKSLPWLLVGVFALPIIVAVALGIVFHWSWITWIFLVVSAVMIGVLLFTLLLTHRADRVGYAKIEGRPGASVSVLSNINKAGFTFPEQPVWVDAKTKDAIWRGTGYNGIYLLGEGDYDRVERAMLHQEQRIKGVTAGSSIPVYRISVGKGSHQVRLRDLRKTVMRCKHYEPTHHSSSLIARIHPRQRFILTKAELNILNERLKTLQRKSGYGIPQGIDPNRPQRISRRAMRGR
ncbi:MAG: DUF4191 domain-containing protein [Bifidobacterium sp.]|jgi:hypothetical protein|nr:DUF4191 domain-containing protein [Bifidobacterium sp.]MCI1864574.1 DUF4191 domain-containing protein [Bifidobacterium sp.]